jgi:O-methyltransferase involved in polyketide biosynthesis
MYLTKDAIRSNLGQIAGLAAGTILAMTFLLPAGSEKSSDRSDRKDAEKGARASRTPFISFFEPSEMLDLARVAGISRVSTYRASG